MSKANTNGSPLARITAHFEAAGLRRFEVPEWGDDTGPLVVCAHPMTIEDKTAINRANEAAGKGGNGVFVEVLVRMARHEDGEKMFGVGDKAALRNHADAGVIERLALKIMASATVEEQEKN